MKFTQSELVRLSEGSPPWTINKNWEIETVIVSLSKIILENLSREDLLRIIGNDRIIKKGEKKCSTCHEIKPVSEFHKNGDVYKSVCKKCRKEYSRLYYKNNKEYWRDYYKEKQFPKYLKDKWGISVSDYKNILQEQDYKCFNCGDKIHETGNDKRLYEVDGGLQIWCRKCCLERN